MSNVSVTTDVVHLLNGVGLIQNLGSDDLYLETGSTNPNDTPPSITSDTGVRLSAGDSISFTSGGIWGVSEGASDVRLLSGGSGVFAAITSP